MRSVSDSEPVDWTVNHKGQLFCTGCGPGDLRSWYRT